MMAISYVPGTRSCVIIIKTILLLCVFLISVPSTTSLSDSEALIYLKASFVSTEAIDSWGTGGAPCSGQDKTWVGVECENDLVDTLSLEGMGLSGTIDIDALHEMKGLRIISLQNNSFSGPIPALNRLGALKSIYLSNNSFSGEIPANFFEEMNSLKKVWLGGNKFTGPIPSSLPLVANLVELCLENNQFSGIIPPFLQPSLDTLNMSNNRLEGEIPPSLIKFAPASFLGNPELCGEGLGKVCEIQNVEKPPPPPFAPPPDVAAAAVSARKSENNIIAAGLMTTAVVLLSIMIVAIFVLRKRQEKSDLLVQGNPGDSFEVKVTTNSIGKKEGERSIRAGRRASGHGKSGADLVIVNSDKGVFGLTDLMKAGAEILGNGALGSSYKAIMSNGPILVVKRIREMNQLENDDFDTEIRRIAGLRHRNILTPLAFHYRKEEKLLISEFVPNGSLLYLLHGDRGPTHAELNWPRRLKIVQGIARGLSYLSSKLPHYDLPHGNLKSSNVLLSDEFEPLLVDFGFSALVTPEQGFHTLLAYRSPEAVETYKVTPKCDVFCLGVVILEILTGKFPCQYLNNGKGGTDVIDWVRIAIADGRETDVLDPEITNWKNSVGEMEKLLHIGASCTRTNPDQRPQMKEVTTHIGEIQVETQRHHGYADQVPRREIHAVNVQESSGTTSKRDDNGSFAFNIS